MAHCTLLDVHGRSQRPSRTKATAALPGVSARLSVPFLTDSSELPGGYDVSLVFLDKHNSHAFRPIFGQLGICAPFIVHVKVYCWLVVFVKPAWASLMVASSTLRLTSNASTALV